MHHKAFATMTLRRAFLRDKANLSGKGYCQSFGHLIRRLGQVVLTSVKEKEISAITITGQKMLWLEELFLKNSVVLFRDACSHKKTTEIVGKTP